MADALPHSTLSAEQQLVGALVDMLKQEQQLLVKADADALAALTPQKTKSVQQLAALSVERHRALGAVGFAASESGMEPWLAAKGTPDVRAQWQRLLALSAEAKELNRVNGMLINKQLAHTQTVLSALRPAGAADTGVYGSKGQAVGGATTRRHGIG
jgi:flagella synthesis protein FlgN